MPSFVCDYCQETVRKQKLDQHKERCHRAAYSCIDCGVSFQDRSYRLHTSCITEVEKYHKSHNKKKQTSSSHNSSMQSENMSPILSKDNILHSHTKEEEEKEVKKTLSKTLQELLSTKKKSSMSLKKFESFLIKQMESTHQHKWNRKQLKKWIRTSLIVHRKHSYFIIKC
jgi:cell growth-regulating nucleolar protein